MSTPSSLITGFKPDEVILHDMVDAEVKKCVIIGDGMSGKTQMLITFSKILIAYLQKIYSTSSGKQFLKEPVLQQAEAKLEEEEIFTISPSFQKWAENHNFLIQYGQSKWNLATVSLDTETIGFEDFCFIFPYVWKGKTYRISLTGSDVGGQNIFDHMRNVLGKIAGSNDILIVVFDKSRALSCWNSVNQVRSVIGEKISSQDAYSSNIPRVIYIGNKIDLEEHIRTHKWRGDLLRSLMKKVNNALNYGKGIYNLPSLVGKMGKERSFQYKLDNNRITFPDLEAFIYNSIRDSDQNFAVNIMTDVNAKALAREIAAQLVFNRKVVEQRSMKGMVNGDIMVSVMNDFGKILFQRRPLAMQFAGGIEYMQEQEESDSFGRVRSKWENFSMDLTTLNDIEMDGAIASAANARNFLSEMGSFYSTNALQGEGIFEVMDSVISEKLKIGGRDPSLSKPSRTIKGRIKRF